MKVSISEILKGRWTDGTRPKDVFRLHVLQTPTEYIEDVLAGLNSDDKRVQSGCAEIASLLSEQRPRLLYPYLEVFVRNLDAKEPVLRWEAVCTIGNLAQVDAEQKVAACMDSILAFLSAKSIVLQGHAVRALSKIAAAFPDHAAKVLRALLAARGAFPGNRIGFLVEAMECFSQYPELSPEARAFAELYVGSDMKSVSTKARRIVRAF